MATPRTAPISADEFEQMDLAEPGRYDLIDGVIYRMAAAGGTHGMLATRFVRWLAEVAEGGEYGAVFTAETGFRLSGAGVVCPDAAFVRRERLPPPAGRAGFLRLAPDLAVEIVSPSDRPGLVEAKVAGYLAAGTPLVVVVDPARRLVVVHRPGEPPQTLAEADTLAGDPVLPGLRIPLAALCRDA